MGQDMERIEEPQQQQERLPELPVSENESAKGREGRRKEERAERTQREPTEYAEDRALSCRHPSRHGARIGVVSVQFCRTAPGPRRRVVRHTGRLSGLPCGHGMCSIEREVIVA